MKNSNVIFLALVTGLLLGKGVPARAAEPDSGVVVMDVEEATSQALEEQNNPDLRIRGFCDVGYGDTERKGANTGFKLGQFTLHFSSPLAQKVRFFGETTLTPQHHNYVPELERLIVRYEYNDLFAVSFGRFHTPVIYWNTAYHHGLWLQTTIDRPEMIKFGGDLVPSHFVGLLTEGRVSSGGLGLRYQVGFGNGRDLEQVNRAGDAGETTGKRAWVANVFARPADPFGLEVGGSLYGDKVPYSDTLSFNELTAAAHFAWTREEPEFIAEVARVRHKNTITNEVISHTAWYAQAAWRLPSARVSLKPYARYERNIIRAGDPIVAQAGYDREVVTVGVRYDISVLAAFKAEYRNMLPLPGADRVNGYNLQTSFTF